MKTVCNFGILSNIYSGKGIIDECLRNIDKSKLKDINLVESKISETETKIQDIISFLNKKAYKIIDSRLEEMTGKSWYDIEEDDAESLAYYYEVTMYIFDEGLANTCENYGCQKDELQYAIVKDISKILQETEETFNTSHLKEIKAILEDTFETLGIDDGRLDDFWLQRFTNLDEYYYDFYTID